MIETRLAGQLSFPWICECPSPRIPFVKDGYANGVIVSHYITNICSLCGFEIHAREERLEK